MTLKMQFDNSQLTINESLITKENVDEIVIALQKTPFGVLKLYGNTIEDCALNTLLEAITPFCSITSLRICHNVFTSDQV